MSQSWRKVREQVLDRDDGECQLCGETSEDHRERTESERDLEVHHIVPQKKGGSDYPDNLVTLCTACHRQVEAWTRDAMEAAKSKVEEERDRHQEKVSELEEQAVDEEKANAAIDEVYGMLMNDLGFVHSYLEKNPTIRDVYGALRADFGGGDLPRISEGTRINMEGEREFWFTCGRYHGQLLAIEQALYGLPIEKREYVNLFDHDNHPVP